MLTADTDVLDSELFASAGEGFGEVAATIVSHDAFDGNAEAPEVGDGGEQERDGAFLLLVGEDFSTRYPRMVVDSHVDEFPACALTAAIACAASGDAVAHAAETAELLNVEMDDLAWFLALVAWMWPPTSSLALLGASNELFGYGRSDRSSKLIRGLGSEAAAGFRSRRGRYREPTPVIPHYAPFASYKAARVHHADRRRGCSVAARIAHEMKDLDAKQTILQGIMFVLQ